MLTTAALTKFIVAMVVMMNPLGSLSIFLQLTHHHAPHHKRRTAVVCGFSMIIIMLVTLWFGRPLLDILGISLPSFRFAGGIILLLTGLAMLQSHESGLRHTAEDDADASKRESIAVVPMALPIIIGPGVISTIIIKVEDFPGVMTKLWFSGICCTLAIIMGILLYYAVPISEAVGTSVIRVITRIMGIIVMSLAVGLLAGGLIGLLPVLGAH